MLHTKNSPAIHKKTLHLRTFACLKSQTIQTKKLCAFAPLRAQNLQTIQTKSFACLKFSNYPPKGFAYY
ncbi:hypothetical protein HYN43_005375 [Mucilaginibacter celer]|uniref:Uncharacterized protein n=1 Tax=Mucilaginibacter celer TaxID=2305508 RepID=A0A494VTS9_9SPHI|nr:hypothetical protein HYN43_005375 [Mucilaginibacter celer]